MSWRSKSVNNLLARANFVGLGGGSSDSESSSTNTSASVSDSVSSSGGYSSNSAMGGSQNTGQSYNYNLSNTGGASSGTSVTDSSGSSSSSQGSNAGSVSNQSVWDPQGQALTGLYGEAGNLYGQTQALVPAATSGASQMIGNVQQGAMPGWQQQMQGGVYGNLGMDRQFTNSLASSMAGPTHAQEVALKLDTGATQGQLAASALNYGPSRSEQVAGMGANNYQNQMQGAMLSDAQRAQQQMLQGVDARAAASGMSGGSRHGTAIGAGMEGINRNLQSNMANIGYQAFESDAARQMQGAGMTDQSTAQNEQLRMQAAAGADDRNLAVDNMRINAANSADNNLLQQQQMMQGYLGGQQGAMAGAVGQSGNMANLGMAGFNPINAQWGNASNLAGILGGPTTLTDSASSSSSFGNSSSANNSSSTSMNDSYNFGMSAGEGSSQNQGTSFNQSTGQSQNWADSLMSSMSASEGSSSGDSSAWNANLSVGQM